MARILIVDDDPDILRLTEQLLSHQGHITFTALDAWKATDLLNEIQFDLLISDAKMPHVSGFDLIQTIRKDSKFKSLAIAMLTGLRDKKDIQRAIEVGVDDYIVKPIDPLILLEKISALFERKPPHNHPQAQLKHNPQLSQCQIFLDVQLISVSELGAVIETPFALESGQTIELTSLFFDHLKAATPPLKVLNSEKTATGYHSQLLFLGAQEGLLQKIRAWIFSHGSQHLSHEDKKAG